MILSHYFCSECGHDFYSDTKSSKCPLCKSGKINAMRTKSPSNDNSDESTKKSDGAGRTIKYGTDTSNMDTIEGE